MIDSYKLKLAHELLKRIPDKNWYINQHIIRRIDCMDMREERIAYMLCHISEYDEELKGIDELIEKLQQLAVKKPKYEVNEYAWVIDEDNQPVHKLILEYDGSSGEFMYSITDCNGEIKDVPESSFYPSKEALIEAQIQYWNKLKIEGMYSAFEGEIKGFNSFRSYCKDRIKCFAGDL